MKKFWSVPIGLVSSYNKRVGFDSLEEAIQNAKVLQDSDSVTYIVVEARAVVTAIRGSSVDTV